MPDFHYENPRLAELYDLDSPWSNDRDFYLSLAGSARKSILDLGCGTGLICNAYAERGHDVTGVDPSNAMLKVARRKKYGAEIEWIQAFAQSYDSDKLFDLIIMTGHAFQVLLNDEDIAACFAVMRKHLKPDGCAVFESRNPLIAWEKQWDYDIQIDTPSGQVRESRRFIGLCDGLMKFDLRYEFPDETLVSQSQLRFLDMTGIEKRLGAAGLRVQKVLGDWNGDPFSEATSQEMIVFATR